MRWTLRDEATKRYGGAALPFERLADDGWPDDAGYWPVGWPATRPNRESRRTLGRLSSALLLARMWRRRTEV